MSVHSIEVMFLMNLLQIKYHTTQFNCLLMAKNYSKATANSFSITFPPSSDAERYFFALIY